MTVRMQPPGHRQTNEALVPRDSEKLEGPCTLKPPEQQGALKQASLDS